MRETASKYRSASKLLAPTAAVIITSAPALPPAPSLAIHPPAVSPLAIRCTPLSAPACRCAPSLHVSPSLLLCSRRCAFFHPLWALLPAPAVCAPFRQYLVVIMANLHDASAVTSSAAEHQKDAEHPGFLQKIKDKLHIGGHLKSDEESGVPSQATTESAAVSGKNVTDAAVCTPPEKEVEPGVATPAPVTSHVDVEPEGRQHGHPMPDLNTLVGHEAEHHGGVPTFLVALPEQDIPDEVTKDTAASDVARGQTGAPDGEEFDSEEVFSKAQQGEHHEGVPTFLVALPDQDIPDTVNKETSSDVSAVPTEEHQHLTQDKKLHSDEMFSNAQRGEHHGGVPTFMVALPDEGIPEEVNKGVSESDTASVGEKSVIGDSGVKEFNSEAVFSQARQGEHHEGVPTFLVALPDQDIPDEVTKGVDATAAPAPAPSVDDAAVGFSA